MNKQRSITVELFTINDIVVKFLILFSNLFECDFINVAMNDIHHRQFVFIIVLLIVGHFNLNCFDLTDIRRDIENFIRNNKPIPIQTDAFIPDKNGYLSESNHSILWKGKNYFILINVQRIRLINTQKIHFAGILIKNNDQLPVAVKFTTNRTAFTRERQILRVLEAHRHALVENNGIPSLYLDSVILNKFYALAITLCNKSIEKVLSINKLPSPPNLLRTFYWAVRL